MFLESSRYASLPNVEATTIDGRTVVAVKLRRLPIVDGSPFSTDGTTHLDVEAQRRFGDGTMFWHVADANSELDANALVADVGRIISMPPR